MKRGNVGTRLLPRVGVAAQVLIPVLDQIRHETNTPDTFPPEVLAAAAQALSHWQEYLSRLDNPTPSSTWEDFAPLPTPDVSDLDALNAEALPHLDATHIPLVTIDPEGSRDLDQAVHIASLDPHLSTDGAAYLLTYAIASVATFLPPNGPVDSEARARALTTYLPDRSTPLHPPLLSEGAASLLPDQTCPACVWQVRLDTEGRALSWTVRRALVRSRAQLTYEQVNTWAHAQGSRTVDPRVPEDLPKLLREVGVARARQEAARGGVSTRLPEQEVVREEHPHDTYHLLHRAPLPCEDWNAQLSLLVGMCAADLMRRCGIGILRTVPPAAPESVNRMRAVARALRIDWPTHMTYPELIRSLDPESSRSAAFLLESTSLFRGAGYTVFGAATSPPFPPEGDPSALHAPIAAEYAHTTAPLRRLADRWALEICVASYARTSPPQWVLDSLADLPSLMSRGAARVSAAARHALSAVEALILEGHIGQTFTGAIVDEDENPSGTPPCPSGTVMVRSPAVMARVRSSVPHRRLPLGQEVHVRLSVADVCRHKVEFVWPA